MSLDFMHYRRLKETDNRLPPHEQKSYAAAFDSIALGTVMWCAASLANVRTLRILRLSIGRIGGSSRITNRRVLQALSQI